MDIRVRLKALMDERGWSCYRLARESGVPESTVRSLFNRDTEPTIRTLEQLCEGLRVTMHQFFDEESRIGLTEEERTLLFRWRCLRETDQELVSLLIQSLAEKT